MRIWTIGAILAVALLGAQVAGASAAESPQWKITSMVDPTHLVPDSPRDEAQEVTVNATGGTFTLSWAEQHGQVTTVPLPYDANAAEVQSALSKFSNWSGTVKGSGLTETSPYTVTFEGLVSNAPVPMLIANSSGLTEGTATVKEVSRGQFAGEVRVVATNIGGAPTNGSLVTLTDALPPGVVAKSVTGGDVWAVAGFPFGMSCAAPPTVSCTYSGTTLPGDQLAVDIEVEVSGSAAEQLVNQVEVSGGGATSSSAGLPLTVSNTPAGFGVQPDSVIAAVSSTQAGAHPSVTTAFAMNTSEENVDAAKPRDIRFDLPPGLVGQVTGMPRCTMAAVEKQRFSQGGKVCPSDTMVGMAVVQYEVARSPAADILTFVTPVYNIAPAPGEPVAFGFETSYLPVRLDTSVLSNGDYGVRVTAPALSGVANVLSNSVTIWGVPAEYNGSGPDFDYFTAFTEGWSFGGSGAGSGEPVVPLLTNPQRCGSALTAVMETDSWEHPNQFVSSEALPMGTLEGCNELRFEPSFSMLPDTLEAGRPAGYSFNLRVPQHNEVGTPATPTVKSVKLTLPQGTVINPSAAWGLKACSDVQFYGADHPSQEAAQPAECPRESQVGKVTIKTPALEEALEGQVYLAQPECDPCTAQDAAGGKMVRLFVNVVGNGEAGIVIKLEGRGMINQETGQITTVFEEDPQLPFSEFDLKLTGGERAVLANPRTCGSVSSSLQMSSWDEALPASNLESAFEVNQNCFGAQFNPSFAAGMPNIQAGSHGEFTLAFGRSDHDQFLKQITLHMPPGLLGTLTGVERCKEAQANAGTCGAGSLLGEAQVLTGPGANPFLVEGGKVYLTEGYGGSQFGLSIVVPAVAGPYTLSGTTGNGTVVVRSQLFINQQTAAITAVSGELPRMLDGIPLQLKAVNVKLNRTGFMFNPTSCEKMAVTGTIASAEGMSANVSSPFQVTNCARLPFTPGFEASTKAQHTRRDGAYFHVVVKSGEGQANIHEVHVELPKQMPTRSATLNHACLVKVFEENPAKCPAESEVGYAKALTPVLPVPIEGPAYFVSYGGQKFPELVIVLQGYGITIALHGETFVNEKTDVIASTFKSVPDVPVSQFELTLPEREYSALGATANLCQAGKSVTVTKRVRRKVNGHMRTVKVKVKKKNPALSVPTTLIGQNGAEIQKTTTVKVSGCGKAKGK